MKYLLITIFFSFFSLLVFSQNDGNNYVTKSKKMWFISASAGLQMSGIKQEDFVKHNVAPALMIGTGVWFTPEIALQVGYKGLYFNTISDNIKHNYYYIFGEVLLNLNQLVVNGRERKSKWSVLLHPGSGYFYNKLYERPNIAANFGIINNYKIIHRLKIFIDISAIMAWDIYQGNSDILPSCVVGLCFSF